MVQSGAGIQGVDEKQQINRSKQMTKTPEKKTEIAQRCGTCLFYRAEKCQRFPPQVVTLGAFQSNSAQPTVNPVSWCGEWAAKKTNENIQ
jgi:hypothetical protein